MLRLMRGFHRSFLTAVEHAKPVPFRSSFCLVPLRNLSLSPANLEKKWISVTFIDREGTPTTVKAKTGDTFLDAAINNDVDLEGFG